MHLVLVKLCLATSHGTGQVSRVSARELSPKVQLRALQSAFGEPRRADIKIVSRQPREGVPLQQSCEREMWQGRGEIFVDGTTRGRRHSLQFVQNNARLEI